MKNQSNVQLTEKKFKNLSYDAFIKKMVTLEGPDEHFAYEKVGLARYNKMTREQQIAFDSWLKLLYGDKNYGNPMAKGTNVKFEAARNSKEAGTVFTGTICSKRSKGKDGKYYYNIKVPATQISGGKTYWKQESNIELLKS